MALIETLQNRQRHLGGEAKATIGFALQTGQIKKRRRSRGRPALVICDNTELALTFSDNGLRFGSSPKTFWFELRRLTLRFFEVGINQNGVIVPRLCAKSCMHFPVVLRFEVRYLFLSSNNDSKSRRLHAANGSKEEAAVFGIERCKCTCAIDADEPISLRSTAGCRLKWLHFSI